MQVLWSRASQTRSSCRCSACLHAASAVARRTTTAASRRRLKIGDLFTACYSTILGTAAFADAKAKEERRKQWDQAIADAKAGSPVDLPERIERTIPGESQEYGLPSVVRMISYAPKLEMLSAQYDDLQVTLDQHLKQSLETTPGMPSLSALPELEGDCEDEVDPDFPPREPITRLHVDRIEAMVSKLVTRLLARSRDLSTLVEPSVSKTDIPQQLKEISTRLQSLRGIDTRLPSYTFHSPRQALQERRRLDNTLEALFKQTAPDSSNIEIILAKICYNLLVSSSPPSIHTYDILIRSLTRLRLHDLAQVVVDSFLFDSKFMPTSATVQLLLKHYSLQKDAAGFRDVVNRMRAVDGDLRIKKRTIDSLHKPTVQKWALTRKVLHKNGYLREKVTRDPDIFDCLINGFLELDRLRSAVRYLQAALREGMQLSSRTLCRIALACTKGLDCEAGLLVLRALLGQWEGDSISTIVYSGPARLAMHRLFSLCGIDTSPESTRPLPYNISRLTVVKLQRHMAIASAEEKLDRFSARLSSVESALVQFKNGFGGSRVKYISEALSVFHKASEFERVQSLRKKEYDDKDALFKDANMRDKNEWLAAQYSQLTRKWKRQYDTVTERCPDLCWADRIEIISIYQQGKDIPRKHRLNWTMSRRGSKPAETCRVDAATKKQPIMVGERPLDREKSKIQVPSPSNEVPKRPSTRSSGTMTLPRTPPSLAHELALSPLHSNCRIGAAAG
jgi:hypothetical protein